ncbi:hypothetical protein AAFP30_28325 [Gordonia sp. CPCC 205515]|uniref:hypothetical protein n=1 Tax=Gordonia sp. CPCC 205515 TaxID=3140791 RepID=UPI003AF34AD9
MTHSGKTPFESTNSLVPAPIDQSLIEMVNHSPLGPILNTPVSKVLADLGLPPLPVAPPPVPAMPGLPPFPAINIDDLFKPVTDLSQSIGSGNLGDSGFDPTMIFTGLSTMMQSTIGLSSGALKAADAVWKGNAATANAGKSASAATDAAAVSTKSSDVAVNTTNGAGTVATGRASMDAVLAEFSAEAAAALATGPTCPPLLIAAAIKALNSAIAVITGTKSALAPQTAQQLANGTQIPITGAPNSPSPFGIAATVLESVGQPLSSFSSTGSQLMGSMTKQLTSAAVKTTGAKDKKDGKGTTPASLAHGGGALGGGGGAGGAGAKKAGGGGGGVGGVGGIATPLSARPGVPNLSTAAVGEAAAPTTPGARASGIASTTTSSNGGMMPMGAGAAGAAGAARGAGSDDGHGSPDFLVTAEHGSEVVGDMPKAAPAVLGGEHETEVESPDIDLRL